MGFFKRFKDDNVRRKRKTMNSWTSNKKKKMEEKNSRNKEVEDEIPSSEAESSEELVTRNKGEFEEEKEESDQEYGDDHALVFDEARRILDEIKQKDDVSEELLDLKPECDEAHVQKEAGKIHRKLADITRFDLASEKMVRHRAHRLTPVCVCFSAGNDFLVSCSKDGSVVKYDLTKHCRVGMINSKPTKNKARKKSKKVLLTNDNEDKLHKGSVICCAISPNDKYLVTGGSDKIIKIWDFHSLGFVCDLNGHRGPITSLRFRRQYTSMELFSSSTDRSIKVWNLDEIGIMNTLFGHQDAIQELDILQWPRLVCCGGMERSCRLFKVLEDSHLVFNGLNGCMSIDTVALINEEHFVSGASDGSIYIWSTARKKPVCVRRFAHGFHSNQKQPHEIISNFDGSVHSKKGEPRWICSVAALPYTDLVASGSSDGWLRLWRVGQDYKTFEEVDKFNVPGFINHICFSSDGHRLACAVGQEHKQGRWWRLKDGVQNRVLVISLVKNKDSKEQLELAEVDSHPPPTNNDSP